MDREDGDDAVVFQGGWLGGTTCSLGLAMGYHSVVFGGGIWVCVFFFFFF